MSDCETCQGTGQIDQRLGGEPQAGIIDCPDCKGTGQTAEPPKITFHLLHDDVFGYSSWNEKPNWKRLTCCAMPLTTFPENHFWTEEHLAAVRLTKPNTFACKVCFPDGKPQFGTPISQVDGRNGGNAAWRRISASWGYD